MTAPSDLLVFAYSYETEAESAEQQAEFAKWVEHEEWLEHEDIGGTSADKVQVQPDGDWCIAVVDATGGRALAEFEWKGEPCGLAREQMMALLKRGEPFDEGKPEPKRNPDGTWTIERWPA